MKRLILIGMRGSGKTTLGQRLAVATGARFIDTDWLIEEKEGMEISEIFRQKGQRFFRNLEQQVILSLPGKNCPDECIISIGGGAVEREENRRCISSLGTVVWLDAEPETIVRRISGSPRPHLTNLPPLMEIKKLLESRRPHYESLSQFTIKTDKGTIEEVTGELEHIWRGI